MKVNIVRVVKISSKCIACQLFNYISVACGVGPSVNTSRARLIFPSEPNFCNLFECLATIFLQFV